MDERTEKEEDGYTDPPNRKLSALVRILVLVDSLYGRKAAQSFVGSLNVQELASVTVALDHFNKLPVELSGMEKAKEAFGEDFYDTEIEDYFDASVAASAFARKEGYAQQ